MKKLLLALLFAGSAMADPVATLSNKAGGMIVLTNNRSKLCSEPNLLAYTTTATGTTLTGCWNVDTLHVFILWSDGALKSYPIENWELLKKQQKEEPTSSKPAKPGVAL